MKKAWGRLYLASVLLILYLPISYLIVFFFSNGKNMNVFRGFTLSHYAGLFVDGRLLAIFLDMIMLALLSSLIATVIGIMGAIAIDATKNKKKRIVLLSLNNVLVVSPDAIIGASSLVLPTALELSLGFGSVLLSHIVFPIPIVVLMVLPRIKEINKSLIDVAHGLDTNNRQIYSKVLTPAATSGILSGLFMALMYSLDDFAVTFFVTGNGLTTSPVETYSHARQGIDLEINALSILMFLIVLLSVGGHHLLTTRHSHKGSRPEIEGSVK